MNGASHNYLAAINLSDGSTVSSWQGAADDAVLAVHLVNNASELVVGGIFTHINGGPQNHIAALSPATGATMPWSTHTPYGVIDLAADANGVYIRSRRRGGGNFSAFSFTGNLLWQGGTNGNMQAITVLDGIVYPGGHYTTYCGPQGGQHTCTSPTVRNKILAVDQQDPPGAAVGAVGEQHPRHLLDGQRDDALEVGRRFTKVAGASPAGLRRVHVLGRKGFRPGFPRAVHREGLEPPRVSPPEPKSIASTSSATPARATREPNRWLARSAAGLPILG